MARIAAAKRAASKSTRDRRRGDKDKKRVQLVYDQQSGKQALQWGPVGSGGIDEVTPREMLTAEGDIAKLAKGQKNAHDDSAGGLEYRARPLLDESTSPQTPVRRGSALAALEDMSSLQDLDLCSSDLADLDSENWEMLCMKDAQGAEEEEYEDDDFLPPELVGLANLLGGGGNQGEGQEAAVQNLCTVCVSEPQDYAFLPCGHLCVCSSCATSHFPEGTACPICRVPTTGSMKIFVTGGT